MAQPKDFGFGSEEQMLRDAARKFLKDHAPIEKLRALVAKDHKLAYESAVQPLAWDERVWKQMVELGWTALAVPESAGGAGMKTIAVAALAEEIGRAALPSPLIATLIATAVLREAGTDAAKTCLERVVGGAAASFAGPGAEGSWLPDATSIAVTESGNGAVLKGSVPFVQEARKAAFFVVAARDAKGGVGLYAVASDAPGLKILPDRVVDLTRDQARVEFDDVKVGTSAIVASSTGSVGAKAVAAALPAILTIVAADLCGAAEWQLQTTAEYARVRTQFDRLIGFFQAVKHPIVNVMIDVDRARSLTYAAACAIDTEPESALCLARMAKAAASDAGAFASSRSIQLHGGIGFTWECDVHIYVKRQKHNQFYFGDGPYQRAKIAQLIDRAA
ncbi:MAG: acyl-CoA/acyl-ACP dehydrogenase [Deltaproteobacteria bacterium]|nr:acyl-CoA/acyl-ACP dehydrogenase [Deltaproteobacteria bacterium]